MRKKLLFVCFAFLMSLSLLTGVSKAFPSAVAAMTNEYVITNSGNSYSVDNGEGAVLFSAWSEAIAGIEIDASDNLQDVVNLNFVNFDLDKTADTYLSFNNSNFNYYLSGSIKSTSDNEIIKVDTENSITISIENMVFDSKNSDYVVLLNGGNHSLYIGGSIEYNNDTTFFTKYVDGCYFGVTEEKLVSVINIVLPYNINNRAVMNYSNKFNYTNIQFLTESDNYFIRSNYDSASQTYIASCFVYVDFDTNGGEYVSHEFNYINYIGTVSYPVDGQVTKFESWLCGWFGKVNHDGQDYYFDAKMLEDFSLVNYDFTQIEDFFVTDLYDGRLDNSKAFSKYSYVGSGYQVKEHFNFFVSNKLRLSYIAKWEFYTYDLSFVTYSPESTFDTKVYKFGEEIEIPENPTLTGYSFVGWYVNAYYTEEFTSTTMPSKDIELHAKWQINKYTISFNSNGGEQVDPISADYNTEINRPIDPLKEGCNFVCWCTDEGLTKEFDFDLMPAENLTLYAKWEFKRYDVYLIIGSGYFEGGGATLFEISYGSIFERPTNDPVRVGYVFGGWYTSNSYTQTFDFSVPIKSITSIYAKWEAINYTISFEMGELSSINPIMQIYDADISFYKPSTPIKTGYSFLGWYTDDGSEFLFNKMPAQNITLIPKWQEKDSLEMTFNGQSYDYTVNGSKYTINSEISGFTVYYLVNNEWTRVVPNEVGDYDIKITRDEDNEYKSFEKIIEKGFSILRIKKDMIWLGIIFNILTIIEIAMVFLIRKMKSMKLSNTYSVALGEIFFISTGQMAYIVISGIIFVAGFVYFMYELVKMIRIANNENFEASKLDNRERFKEDLVFQRNVEIDPNFTYETKTKESFGSKYSDEDIKKMLEYDDYSDNLIKAREDKLSNEAKENDQTNSININSLIEDNTVLNEIKSNEQDDNFNQQNHKKVDMDNFNDFEIVDEDDSEEDDLL